jgi:plasmid maintenance system antidote protein VapI
MSEWTTTQWQAFLAVIEYEQHDIDEMCRGEYPISPSVIRIFSALFGLKVEFLLLGQAPVVDRVGGSISQWLKANSQ